MTSSKLTRVTQNIFGATGGAIGQFGSGQLGTKVITTDPSVVQSLAAWAAGWNNAIVSGQRVPPLEDMNGVFFQITQQLATNIQQGIAEWDSGTTYYISSLVRNPNTTQIYASLTDPNLGHALSSGTNWVLLGDLANLTNAANALLKANNLSDLTNISTARTNLQIDKRTTFSNANYTVLTTDSYVAQIGTMTASRTVTLPAASSVNAGYEVIITDESATVTSTNTIVIVPNGSDTLDGASSETISIPYSMRRLISNGSNKWIFDKSVLRAANNLSDLTSVSTARVNLNIDKRTTFSNADYTILSTDKKVAQIGTMTASRTVTLPAASSVNAGYEIAVYDESGTVTSSNTIVIAAAGSDTLDSGTSTTITLAYGAINLISNGSGKWNFTQVGSYLTTANNLSDLASASTARSNLGVAIGSQVQAHSANLDSLAGLAGSNLQIPYFTGSSTMGLIPTTLLVPTGAISAYVLNAPPTGWLECNGSPVSRITYATLFALIGSAFGPGDGSTTFNLPDLRGYFIRGWSHAANTDLIRAFGTLQNDSVQGHYHQHYENQTTSGGARWAAASTVITGAASNSVQAGDATTMITDGTNGTPRISTETRPINLALMYIIKY